MEDASSESEASPTGGDLVRVLSPGLSGLRLLHLLHPLGQHLGVCVKAEQAGT